MGDVGAFMQSVTPMTCIRPSLAMWRIVGIHASLWSYVGDVDLDVPGYRSAAAGGLNRPFTEGL